MGKVEKGIIIGLVEIGRDEEELIR